MRTSLSTFLPALVLCCHAGYSQITSTKLIPLSVPGNIFFASTVALSGDRVLVGSVGEFGQGVLTGAAYIFKRDGAGWIRDTRLVGTVEERFGGGAISGDYVLLGDAGNDLLGYKAGAVYVFKHDGSAWLREATLTASDAEDYVYFGGSISISGEYAIVGAPGSTLFEHEGAAYIFRYNGIEWIEEDKLAATDGSQKDLFGVSVSVSGDYAVIGAPANDDNGAQSGSVYVFMRDGTDWVQRGKLTPGDPGRGDFFGGQVSISGDYLVTGSGSETDDGTDSGSAYVFRREGSVWIQEAKINPADAATKDGFGRSVSISGDHIAIGSFRDDDNGGSSGSAYIFEREGTTWVQKFKLLAPDGVPKDHFGRSVALSGNDVVVGATGYAYVFSGISAVPSIEVGVSISPASGEGDFDYAIDLTNTADSAFTVDIWTEMLGPRRDKKVGSANTGNLLLAGQSYTFTGGYSMDAGSPAGDYLFTTNVGLYPDVVLSSGSASYTKTALGKSSPTDDGERSPSATTLRNYPNPFNPTTTISYWLATPSSVRVRIYDLLGREVADLSEGIQEAGYNRLEWDATGVPSGVYLCRLSTPHLVQTRRLILLR